MVTASQLRHHGHSTAGESRTAGFFERLPDRFSFKKARVLYGKLREAVNMLIRKMMNLVIVRKTAHGQYCRAGCARAGAV
jgi:hypothetical protein